MCIECDASMQLIYVLVTYGVTKMTPIERWARITYDSSWITYGLVGGHYMDVGMGQG